MSNYAKALRIVRAHRGLDITEAAEKWCMVVNGDAHPRQIDRFATLLETLETGLEPNDRQLSDLARAYDVSHELFSMLAIDKGASMPLFQMDNAARAVYHFIAGDAP